GVAAESDEGEDAFGVADRIVTEILVADAEVPAAEDVPPEPGGPQIDPAPEGDRLRRLADGGAREPDERPVLAELVLVRRERDVAAVADDVDEAEGRQVAPEEREQIHAPRLLPSPRARHVQVTEVPLE